MTKYEKLLTMKDNFTRAASMAESTFAKALWLTRAEDVQVKIETITNKEACENYHPKLVVIRAMEKNYDRLHNNKR